MPLLQDLKKKTYAAVVASAIREKNRNADLHELMFQLIRCVGYVDMMIEKYGGNRKLDDSLEPPLRKPAKTERLARPLIALSDAEQINAWQDAVTLAGNDRVRPEHIAAATAKRTTRKVSKKKK